MSDLSWVALYPEWYVEERRRLDQHYPSFRPDEAKLQHGILALYGEIIVRPKGGSRRHPVMLAYPAGTPYEKPIVVPLISLPEFDESGAIQSKPIAKLFDYRHQMPGGALCLFQHEPRLSPGGDIVTGVDALRRATYWFTGLHTGHWPPDSIDSELESHFSGVGDILFGDVLYGERFGSGHGRFFSTRDGPGHKTGNVFGKLVVPSRGR